MLVNTSCYFVLLPDKHVQIHLFSLGLTFLVTNVRQIWKVCFKNVQNKAETNVFTFTIPGLLFCLLRCLDVNRCHIVYLISLSSDLLNVIIFRMNFVSAKNVWFRTKQTLWQKEYIQVFGNVYICRTHNTQPSDHFNYIHWYSLLYELPH